MLNKEMLKFKTCFYVSFVVISNRTLWLHHLLCTVTTVSVRVPPMFACASSLAQGNVVVG